MSRTGEDRSPGPLAPHLFEILLSLSQGPLHGYELVRDIRERTEGSLNLGTSTLYSALRRLLEAGWVEEARGEGADQPSGGPPRRYYTISAQGRAVAETEALRMERSLRHGRRLLGLQRRSSEKAP